MPPAVRLFLAIEDLPRPAAEDGPDAGPHPADAELLDGLLQHPATRPWLGDRLGPKAVVDRRRSARAASERLERAGHPSGYGAHPAVGRNGIHSVFPSQQAVATYRSIPRGTLAQIGRCRLDGVPTGLLG